MMEHERQHSLDTGTQDSFASLPDRVKAYLLIHSIVRQPRVTDKTKERLYKASSEISLMMDPMERAEFMKFQADRVAAQVQTHPLGEKVHDRNMQ